LNIVVIFNNKNVGLGHGITLKINGQLRKNYSLWG
jgi:hypothetical protein